MHCMANCTLCMFYMKITYENAWYTSTKQVALVVSKYFVDTGNCRREMASMLPRFGAWRVICLQRESCLRDPVFGVFPRLILGRFPKCVFPLGKNCFDELQLAEQTTL